jgi:Tfp pilus assembly protein PilE
VLYKLRLIVNLRRGECCRVGGFALIESLVGLTIFAVLGLAFANSIISGHKLRQRMIHRSAALQVATDEMERQTRLRASNLTAGTTTTTVTKGNMQFQRVVTIAATSAGGYTVTVSVTDLNNTINGSVQLQNTLVPFGST